MTDEQLIAEAIHNGQHDLTTEMFFRLIGLARKGFDRWGEAGWLCELPSTAFGPSWWCVPEHEFTTDASKALRFARKQDAEDYIAETGEWTDVIATEHMWPSPPSTSEREK